MTKVDGTKVYCEFDDVTFTLVTCLKELDAPQTAYEEEDDTCLEDTITKTAIGKQEKSVMEFLYKYEVNSAAEQVIRAEIGESHSWKIEHPDATTETFTGLFVALIPQQYVNGNQRLAKIRVVRNSAITYA